MIIFFIFAAKLEKNILLFLVNIIILLTSCAGQDNPVKKPVIQSKIVSYNEYGAAMLNVTATDMNSAGFAFGDVISITFNGQEIDIPYYNGFYSRNGEYICVAYHSKTSRWYF